MKRISHASIRARLAQLRGARPGDKDATPATNVSKTPRRYWVEIDGAAQAGNLRQ